MSATASPAARKVAQHTPAPWLLESRSYGFDLCVKGVSEGSTGGWFVELHGGVRVDDEPEFKAEFEANARLIAAAPALLFALEQLVGMAVVWETVEGRKNIRLEDSEAYQRARAAIAKVTA